MRVRDHAGGHDFTRLELACVRLLGQNLDQVSQGEERSAENIGAHAAVDFGSVFPQDHFESRKLFYEPRQLIDRHGVPTISRPCRPLSAMQSGRRNFQPG